MLVVIALKGPFTRVALDVRNMAATTADQEV